jgi:hypothetical protein
MKTGKLSLDGFPVFCVLGVTGESERETGLVPPDMVLKT